MVKKHFIRFSALVVAVAAVFLFRGCSEPPTEWDPTLRITLPLSEVSGDAGSQRLTIESDAAWTISITNTTSAGYQWLTADRTNGSGNAFVTLSYTDNPVQSRSARITVTAGTQTREVTLTQRGDGIVLELSLPNTTLSPSAGSQNLRIEANVAWTVSVTNTNPAGGTPWLTLSRTSGTGTATFSVSWTAHSVADSREARITVTSGQVTRTLTVTQLGTAPPPRYRETPEVTDMDNMWIHTHYATMGGRNQRNYTIYYDKARKTALWVSYPLHKDHTGGSGSQSWRWDDALGREYQVDLTNSYGATFQGVSVSRGHQIPNADRNGVSAMQRQTYYFPNATPQIQDRFNGSIWAAIERQIRENGIKSDTAWVVTGASFADKSINEPEFVHYITHNRTGEQIRVPKYYWKVAVRYVDGRWSGVGIWIEHQAYTGARPSSFAMPVREIERKTGFNFFPTFSEAEQNTFEATVIQSDWFASGQ
jgi:endonuclease G